MHKANGTWKYWPASGPVFIIGISIINNWNTNKIYFILYLFYIFYFGSGYLDSPNIVMVRLGCSRR